MPKVMSCARILLQVLRPGAACGRAGRRRRVSSGGLVLAAVFGDRLVDDFDQAELHVVDASGSSLGAGRRSARSACAAQRASAPARRDREVLAAARDARRRARSRSGAGSRRARRTGCASRWLSTGGRSETSGLVFKRCGYGARRSSPRSECGSAAVMRTSTKLSDQARASPGEIDDAVVVGAAGELAGVSSSTAPSTSTR